MLGGCPKPASLLPSFVAVVIALVLLLHVHSCSAGGVGVSWGRNSWQPFPPRVMVKLLQDNGIRRLKLFSADADVLHALIGKNIEVSVMLSNIYLAKIASSQSEATRWVAANVKPFIYPGGVNITQIAVGNEPFLRSYGDTYVDVVVPALTNVQQALVDLGLAPAIKVTVPLNADILWTSYPPSAGVIRLNIAKQVTQIAAILKATGGPFTINIYPFYSLFMDGPAGYVTPKMALMEAVTPGNQWTVSPGGWNYVDPVTHLRYGNIFDGTFDATLAALGRIGYGDLHLEIGEIGWPTEGDNKGTSLYATARHASTFTNAMIAHMLSGAGTPARPFTPITGFLFSLADEDRKPIIVGAFERHWGIFRSDGTPKFAVDFSGGLGARQDVAGFTAFKKALTRARGLKFLPPRWCVSRPNTPKKQLLNILAYACSQGFAVDCTPILPGGSCRFNGNIAKMADYVMNSYYQLNNQAAHTCYFQGAAGIVATDPSFGTCKFMLGILP